MNAYTPPIRTPQIDRWVDCDALDDAVETHDFDCSPAHRADVARSYPGFGKASPERRAYLVQRDAGREAYARAQVGWLTRYNDNADDAVVKLAVGMIDQMAGGRVK